MDDKEKEKFGVIIDKNDQGTDNQPKVDDAPVNSDINKESKISEPRTRSTSFEMLAIDRPRSMPFGLPKCDNITALPPDFIT